MIELRSDVHKELVSFLKAVTGNNVPVYNLEGLSNTPSESTRVEYRLENFKSTGQVYNKYTQDLTTSEVSSVSEYRCQLMVRTIGTPLFSSEMIGRIAGAMQTHGYLEQIIHSLAIKNETIKTMTIPVKDNGVLYNICQLKVDCYVGIEHKYEIDYFDTIDDVEVIIDDDLQVIIIE